MEEPNESFRSRKHGDPRATIPGCRICLLPRDLSPSPLWGAKKDTECTLLESLTARLKTHFQSVEELLGAEPVERPEDGKLIVPCKCKGTMKYVHRGCLNVWRMHSTRRDSYYKCEQCFTAYQFQETGFSKVLASPIVTRLLTFGIFSLWVYGWFLFVLLTQRLTGVSGEDGYFVDYQDLMAMGQGRFVMSEPTASFLFEKPVDSGVFTEPSGSILDYFTNYGSPEPEPQVIFNSQFSFLPLFLQRLVEHYLLEIVYTMIIVALFDTLITSPSVILSVNIIYLLWRSIKAGGQFELAWLAACIGFSLARSVMTINSAVTAIIQRYIKLKCIMIVNLEDLPTHSDLHRNQRSLRVETQLY